jgi:hypothetical protein
VQQTKKKEMDEKKEKDADSPFEEFNEAKK